MKQLLLGLGLGLVAFLVVRQVRAAKNGESLGLVDLDAIPKRQRIATAADIASGAAPGEVIEFYKLTMQKTAALKTGVAMKTRSWQVKAVK